MITIESINQNSFKVTVNKESTTEHLVLLNDNFYQSITNGKITKKDLIIKSFEFLLLRESNQSILKEFNLEVINQYFPEYNNEIKKIIL
ncbi:hypothetical protein N9Z16_01300 [Methylophilaceae bacterium]|jgi:hypothetical protein|nr:hypothetical protein [Betaproteobacteria bacterium]MDB2679622.1 hypothetical protein [Methylophilaceae bacterium]